MDARGTVGLYGKIPGRGDFISRRVSREFTEFWDPWLQNSLSCSRTQLNEKWLNVYLTSPIWRFVLSPGLCGRKVWIGVVMPSVDKVGRYFPLTIVTSLPEEINPFNITTLALDWFNHAESIALSTLEENNFDFDVFDKQVDQLSQYLPEFDGKDMQASVSSVNFRTSNGWRFPAERANSVDKSYSSLLWQLTNNRFSTYSLWWCNGSENIEPSLLVSDGLPSVESYAAMLDGQWQQWSWDVCPVQYLPDFPSRDKPDDVVPKNGITPNVPEPKIEPQPETLEPSVLKEPIIIEADIAQEHEEVQDNWWIEETDQLAKDAISNVANNLTDDTPESLLLMTDPAEDELLAQTMLFGDEARAEVDAENIRMEVEPLAKPMFVEKETLDVDSIDKTSLIEEDSMAQTMIIAAPESIEDSIEKTQLFFADSRIVEPIDKTELNAASVLNLNRSTAQEPESNSGQKVTINESTILGSLSETNEMGLGIETIGETIGETSDESNDDSEVSASADSDNIASDLDNVGGLGQNKRIHFDWTSTACTDAGKVRKINEDAYLDYPQRGIWVVADGVGGHTGGAIASQMIVRQLLKVKRPKNLASFIEDVQNQLQYVNRYLLENVSESQEYLVGSTVAVLLIYGNNAACVWAGDSRIYLNRDGKTRRLTKDHSEEEEQADAIRRNEIVESLKPVNPNIITRAIGADNLLELDIEIIDLLEDDAFLICSDGLYKEVSEDEIAEYLNREDTEVISRGLLNLALDRNARDNVTVISVMLAG